MGRIAANQFANFAVEAPRGLVFRVHDRSHRRYGSVVFARAGPSRRQQTLSYASSDCAIRSSGVVAVVLQSQV
jgi:hypothetical protein